MSGGSKTTTVLAFTGSGVRKEAGSGGENQILGNNVDDCSQKSRKGWLARMVVLLHKYKNNDFAGLEADMKWYQEHHAVIPAMKHLEHLVQKHGKDVAYGYYS
ncbi:unnamed protein product [Symbiodinium sp. CCMP2592]|nr:unnamed protein product [Symbiodinium sp. CCMP2592]